MLHNDLGNALDRRGDVAGALASYARALAHGDAPAIRGNFARCVAAAGSIALDEPLRALLTRALAEAWVRPADLARVCCAAIDPARSEAELARDPLLRAVLTSTTVRSVALEQRLTDLRRAWLAEALEGDDDGASSDDALAFRSALARACFINEYVFDCETEAAQVEALRIRLGSALSAGQMPRLASLLAGASYFALAELQGAQALLEGVWPAAVGALLQQQVGEPLEERHLRAALPRLTPIRDEVSRRVQAQYEENPYPRWVRAGQVGAQQSIDADLRRQFPLAAMAPLAQDAAAEVLVAGCGTGQEPVELAKRWPAARIVAVDLSAASLAYAARQTRALGVANVDYAQADVLELPAQPRRFDIVSAVGVLHHLGDPAAGLRALVDVLRPGGLMRLGFYSERARRDVVAARHFIAQHGYAGEAAQIRRCRQDLIARGDEFARVLARSDFYATSECRDLLFHVQEHRFTLPAIAALLAAHGLRVVGMLLEPRVLQRYVERFPDDPAAVNLTRLDAFEDAFPDTFAGMYRLWVQKPSAAAPTRRP
jgi:SAM-dependent methyltransferase